MSNEWKKRHKGLILILNLRVSKEARSEVSKNKVIINSLISVMNEKKRHKCLILMLNLKVSKQTRSKASKNKVIIKRVSNISIN